MQLFQGLLHLVIFIPAEHNEVALQGWIPSPVLWDTA